MIDPAHDRFARQRLIPHWDQERISRATAVVIGVGALGNEVAKNLALLGIGRLILCDPDTVSESNLSRTVLFHPTDNGQRKVEVAACALRCLVPGLTVDPRPELLTAGVGMGELADADIVLGCLDSRRARLALLARCAMVGARLVDGGTHPWGGEVRVRLDPLEACHGCSYSAAQRAESDAPAGCDPVDARTPAPASILSTALVGAWMSAAACQVVLGQPPPWRFLNLDISTGRSEPIVVRRDPTCPHHHPFGTIELSEVSHTSTVNELLTSLPPDAEPLTWTLFSLPGACNRCNGRYDVGNSYARGTAECPHCGSRLRVRFSQSVRDAHRQIRLYELGVADAEVLAVRLPEGKYRWLRLNENGPRAI